MFSMSSMSRLSGQLHKQRKSCSDRVGLLRTLDNPTQPKEKGSYIICHKAREEPLLRNYFVRKYWDAKGNKSKYSQVRKRIWQGKPGCREKEKKNCEGSSLDK